MREDNDMAREKLTELLTESICVTPEEATAALEARDWDVLEAAQLLQRERRAANVQQRSQSKRGLFARFFGV